MTNKRGPKESIKDKQFFQFYASDRPAVNELSMIRAWEKVVCGGPDKIKFSKAVRTLILEDAVKRGIKI